MPDTHKNETTVTVPRWALDYVLQNADCNDDGKCQSREMIAARYQLELALDVPTTQGIELT